MVLIKQISFFDAKHFFFFFKGTVPLCVHFNQIEPLGVFVFNKEETLGSGTAEPSTIAAYSLALSN